MIHDAKSTLPSTVDLTVGQIGRFRQSLERSLEGVVEQWIRETGIERVNVTIHVQPLGSIDSKTRPTHDLFVNAQVIVRPASGLIVGEEEEKK